MTTPRSGAVKRQSGIALCLCALVLAVGCSERSVAASGSGDEILWTYGDDDRIVLSSPVEDSDHNIFVIVGDVGSCEGCARKPVDRVWLFSFSPSGEERWSTQLSGESRDRPWVVPSPTLSMTSGETTLCVDGDIIRISNAGAVLWRVEDGCGDLDEDCWDPSHALAEDGSYAVLRRVPAGIPEPLDRARVNEVLVYGRDGQVLWSRTIGFASLCRGELGSALPGTFVHGLALDAAGDFVLGCDTCAAGPAVVRLDATTGALVHAAAIPSEFTEVNDDGVRFSQYSGPVLEDGNAWLFTYDALGSTLWRVDGSTSAVPGVSLPLAAGGRVQRDFTSDDVLQILWGDDTVVLDPAEAAASPEFAHAHPIAVVADDRIAMVYYRYGSSGSACGNRCGLYVMQRDGRIAWRSPDETMGIPLVSDGAIAYVTTEQHLVVREAPVAGLADGSWPSVLADAQGSFREAK